jgi:hypothetical protein
LELCNFFFGLPKDDNFLDAPIIILLSFWGIFKKSEKKKLARSKCNQIWYSIRDKYVVYVG